METANTYKTGYKAARKELIALLKALLKAEAVPSYPEAIRHIIKSLEE